jgi:hypothetical protein
VYTKKQIKQAKKLFSLGATYKEVKQLTGIGDQAALSKFKKQYHDYKGKGKSKSADEIRDDITQKKVNEYEKRVLDRIEILNNHLDKIVERGMTKEITKEVTDLGGRKITRVKDSTRDLTPEFIVRYINTKGKMTETDYENEDKEITITRVIVNKNEAD